MSRAMNTTRVVLITGANGGLGNAVTRAFLESGATVFGVARAITAAEFPHPSFRAIAAEVRAGTQAADIASEVLREAGRIDALVHLVGGFAGGHTVEETDDAVLDRMLDLNLRAAFHCCRAVLPAMRAQRRGAITAVGSRTAVDPQPLLGAYSASKAALVSLMRTIALEGKADGITANVVLPGTMDTPANRAANPGADPSRWVRPSDVAALLLHLTSPAATAISGAVIPVYGGDL